MPLFQKNPNEAAYAGGKKHWADVIKNTGPGDLLIWKQPEEDFNTNSTLIVTPGEQAIFVKGGNIESIFEEGTYKLSTNNYPFISRLRTMFTGGISTFNCVVYFVRLADSRELKWGTETPIQVRDKVHGIRTEARVRGSYKIRIVQPGMFLKKLVGGNVPLQFQESLFDYFASEFQGKIKAAVSRYLNGLQQELIGIDAYMDEISQQIAPTVDEALQEYGLRCVTFSLAGLDIDISKYDMLDEATILARRQITEAQGQFTAMETLGDKWSKLQAAQILNNLANNPGAGGVGAMGAGLGMGAAAGSIFGGMASQMFAPMAPAQQQSVPKSAQPTPSGRFAPRGAEPPKPEPQAPADDPMEVLGKLKKMLDAGLIEQAEYDAKKAEILSRM